MSNTNQSAILYEHEDGRYAVAASPEGAAFAHGDPKWHRVGPVEVCCVGAASNTNQSKEEGSFSGGADEARALLDEFESTVHDWANGWASSVKVGEARDKVLALLADAGRYRFLRDSADPDAEQPYVTVHKANSWGKWFNTVEQGAELDAAIDAALSSQSEAATTCGAPDECPMCLPHEKCASPSSQSEAR